MPVPKRFLFWDRQAPAVSVAKILFVCHGRRAWIRKTSRGCSSFWVTSIAFNALGPNTANLGEVTVEIVSITIYQKTVNETIVTAEWVRFHIPSVSATDTRRPK